MRMPRTSTGAPGASPRTVPRKRIRKGTPSTIGATAALADDAQTPHRISKTATARMRGANDRSGSICPRPVPTTGKRRPPLSPASPRLARGAADGYKCGHGGGKAIFDVEDKNRSGANLYMLSTALHESLGGGGRHDAPVSSPPAGALWVVS